MPFSSSNIYAVHLFDLLYSCKNWMDLQAKTSQKCKQFSGLLIHLDKKNLWNMVLGILLQREWEKLGTIISTNKEGLVGFFFFFFFHSKACYSFILYTASSLLWISKLLNISKAQAIFFTFDKWHTLKQFAINRQGNCCIDSSLLL